MPGLLRGLARTAAVAGTATAVSNRVSRRQGGRWARKEEEEAEAEPAQDAAPAVPPPDRLGQLKQLGELRDQNVLTEAEFQQQKAQILNS
jgi:hypothetical protein